MKKIFGLTLIILETFLLSTSLIGCKNINIEEESRIQKVFIENAYYDTDGNYRFREYNVLGNITYSYCFTYSPEQKLYNANLLVTTNSNINLYDYAAITFSWGQFQKALFYAYHELDSIARIEFEYNILSYDYNIGEDYNYRVKSNTFVNLTEKDDIDNYASQSYDCLKRIVPFIKKILSKYNTNTNLW